MPIPTIEGVGAQASGTTGAVAYPIPAHVAGDILLAFIETNLSTGVTAPSGWAHITGSPRTQGSNVVSVSVLIRRATAPGHTLTVAGVANHQVGQVVVVRGVVPTGQAWDFAPVDSGAAAANSFSATGGTTTVGNTRTFVACAGSADVGTDQFTSVTNGSLSGFAEVDQAWTADGNGGGVGIWSGTRVSAGSTGTTTGNITTSSTTANLVFSLIGASASSQNESGGAAAPVVTTATGSGTAAEMRSGGAAAPVVTAAAGGGTASEARSGGASGPVVTTAVGAGSAAELVAGGSLTSVAVAAVGAGSAAESAAGGAAGPVVSAATGAGTPAEAAAGGAPSAVVVTATGGGSVGSENATGGSSASVQVTAAGGAGLVTETASGGSAAAVLVTATGGGMQGRAHQLAAAERLLVVPAENRRLIVPAEVRRFTVPPETRHQEA